MEGWSRRRRYPPAVLGVIADAARAIVSSHTGPDGVSPPLLLVLTVVTGVVDATSYRKLGHVFVANMTGNVVFLGFALAGTGCLSIASSLVSIAAFLAGALAGGRLGLRLGARRVRLLTVAIAIEAARVIAALIVAAGSGTRVEGAVSYVLIVLFALALDLQNATARRLAVLDLTTSVLTLMLTGLAIVPNLRVGTIAQVPKIDTLLLLGSECYAPSLLKNG